MMNLDMRPQSFSIGNVVRLSWQGIQRHVLALVVACLAAGFAASALPIAAIQKSAWFLEIWVHPLRRELIHVAVAMTVVVNAGTRASERTVKLASLTICSTDARAGYPVM